nr:hypothetical protein [Tanacetum cinerariifolium]
MALTFAGTHNMIAYLTKSDASEGFDQIIDFLNASAIKEKVNITEATVREALRLDDVESIDCLPNDEIFTELSRMGSSMASPVICLSTVAAGVDVDDVLVAVAEPNLPSPKPTTQPPPPSQELPSTSQVIPTPPPSLIAQPSSPPQQPQPSQPTHGAEISLDLLHILLETCTTLTRKVEALEQDKVAQALEIIKGCIQTGGIIELIDTDKDVTLEEVEVDKNAEVEENADVQGRPEEASAKERERRQCCVEVSSIEKEATDRNPSQKEVIYLRNMAGFKIDYFKGISYNDICLIFEKYLYSNVAFLEKTKERLEEKESIALKRTSESLEEKAAKKQKLDEEVEELKKHIQIVPNNDDDVYTEATPLALKVPVVDYEIYTENNKPYYKIIRADGTHQLFLSFLSLLRNFNREDLEVLWQIVKKRFASSKLKNFLDDFLLTTLTYMFENPDVEA